MFRYIENFYAEDGEMLFLGFLRMIGLDIVSRAHRVTSWNRRKGFCRVRCVPRNFGDE